MFHITTSHHFYAMLVADFDDFMVEPQSGRLALHCAITAYHLHEWVWGDWLKRDYVIQKALGVRDRASFLAWIDGACVWFSAVQGLAQGTKHFIPRQGFDTMIVGAVPFAFDQPTAGLDEGSLDSPTPFIEDSDRIGPHGRGYLLIDYG